MNVAHGDDAKPTVELKLARATLDADRVLETRALFVELVRGAAPAAAGDAI